MRDRLARSAWVVAVAAALAPLLAGFSTSRVFYLRDLSMFFWGRHLSFRRELLSGTFPLWDPYVGGGQSTTADALRQMFLPPAVLLRLMGPEALGFNLWVAAPFPLAAAGAWLFFRRRFSPWASAIGAIAFAIAGPTISTSNFPNFSWSVAAIGWVLWAADRLAAAPTPRALAVLALTTAGQALAGEPVTLLATHAMAFAFVIVMHWPASSRWRERLRPATVVMLGMALGFAVAAIQLVPLRAAAAQSFRAAPVDSDFWSLHPLSLLDALSLHVFGNYNVAPNLRQVPWLPPLNDGREPFLFSLYFGVPLLTLSLFGLALRRSRRWGIFWALVALAASFGAFGAYTPIYPFVRDHLPLLPSFRFPAKYMALVSMAVAAGAAAGWDALAERIEGRARTIAAAAVVATAVLAAIAAAVCLYLTGSAWPVLLNVAERVGTAEPVRAAGFMILSLPRHASLVLLLAAATGALFWLATGPRREAPAARLLLGTLVVIDLIVRAWGVNPVIDRRYLDEPAWVTRMHEHPEARFYVGSKRDGTLLASDLDSSGPPGNPDGLVGCASRAAVSGQLNFEPSGWRVREMNSYDLAVLWPARFASTMARFYQASSRVERDRFLDRTSVRYRVLPAAQAPGRTPLTKIPYAPAAYLYDWGESVLPRAYVVREATLVPDANKQAVALFNDGWDARSTVLVEAETPPAGRASTGAPSQSAAIVEDGPHRVVVDARVPDGGGYLVLLDSFSEDWRVDVDGERAAIVRANGLFRAVRLVAGAHRLEFTYRPRAFILGAVVSVVSTLLLIVLAAWPLAGRRRSEAVTVS